VWVGLLGGGGREGGREGWVSEAERKMGMHEALLRWKRQREWQREGGRGGGTEGTEEASASHFYLRSLCLRQREGRREGRRNVLPSRRYCSWWGGCVEQEEEKRRNRRGRTRKCRWW